MSNEQIVTSVFGLLIAVFGGGGLSALVSSWFSRRSAAATAAATEASANATAEQADASAADVIEQVAARQLRGLDRRMQIVEEQNEKLRKQNIILAGEVAELKREREQTRDVLLAHAAWDRMAGMELTAAGIDVGPVPPLTAPHRLRTEEGHP